MIHSACGRLAQDVWSSTKLHKKLREKCVYHQGSPIRTIPSGSVLQNLYRSGWNQPPRRTTPAGVPPDGTTIFELTLNRSGLTAVGRPRWAWIPQSTGYQPSLFELGLVLWSDDHWTDLCSGHLVVCRPLGVLSELEVGYWQTRFTAILCTRTNRGIHVLELRLA